MNFVATKQKVTNRGIPSSEFLTELVQWGKTAAPDIFAPNQIPDDIYSSVVGALGPWQGAVHRRAAMLEVMRVLAGFESSWNWSAGADPNTAEPGKIETLEAGAWQVSANSMKLGPELKALVVAAIGTEDPSAFRAEMKKDHRLAMEYIARLLRRSVAANGPVVRHEIDQWLKRDAVTEFQNLLAD